MKRSRARLVVVGRLAPVPGGLRAVQQQVLRSFAATGHAPAATALADTAARYGTAAAAVLAALHAGDYLRLGPDGQIRAAYPFSGVPTPHLVDIDGGPRVYAMCAIDALGTAAMLGTGVTITSADPGTGQEVTVTVRADGKTAWQPATAVVFNGRLISADACDPVPGALTVAASAEACDSVPGALTLAATADACDPVPDALTVAASADSCCGYMNFFGTRASAAAWEAAHPGITGEILGQAAAVRLGVDIFSGLLSEASGGPDR